MTVRPTKFNFEFQMRLPGREHLVEIFRDAATGVMMKVKMKIPVGRFTVPTRSYYLESAPAVEYDTIERLLISSRRDLLEARVAAPAPASAEAPSAGQSPVPPILGSPLPGGASD